MKKNKWEKMIKTEVCGLFKISNVRESFIRAYT